MAFIGAIPSDGAVGSPWQVVAGPEPGVGKLRWAADGKALFFVRNQDAADTEVWSVPFDPDLGRATGVARRVTAFSDPSLRVLPNSKTDA